MPEKQQYNNILKQLIAYLFIMVIFFSCSSKKAAIKDTSLYDTGTRFEEVNEKINKRDYGKQGRYLRILKRGTHQKNMQPSRRYE